MSFTRMGFVPSDGLKNTGAFPAKPESEEDAREQFQRLFDQIKEQVNALMSAMERNDNMSGAHQIGSGPIGQLSYEGALARPSGPSSRR